MRRATRVAAFVLAAVLAIALAALASAWAPDRPVSALQARWAPPPSAFVDVKGLAVHVRDVGPRDDPLPIVLLHGTSASLHTWEGWAASLARDRRVISMDLPGFGLTGPNTTGDYRMAAYVRFVLDTLDVLNVRRFIVAGNSLGGNVAWETALAAPERVARLILVDAGGYPPTSTSVPLGFRLARTPVLNRMVSRLLPRRMIEASLRNVYGDPSRVTPELVDRYEELTLRAGNRRAVVQRFEQSDFGAGAARIASLKLPTLILWGGRDRLIPPEHGQRFARDIAGSTLVVFDTLGHVPQEEDPARTVAPVRRFVGLPG
ncbi:MAG TPA: alpha/beta fold hydrolase [Albitalea sp.]|nr:alpha/beta fold hydrolase [Albitalea sp.]